jgi:hypothetical protein
MLGIERRVPGGQFDAVAGGQDKSRRLVRDDETQHDATIDVSLDGRLLGRPFVHGRRVYHALAVLALLLCAGLACADNVTPAATGTFAPKPEVVDEADVLRVQLAESRADALAAKIESARRDLETLQKAAQDERAKLTAKYRLAAGDQVDPTSREIKRAPKKDVKK